MGSRKKRPATSYPPLAEVAKYIQSPGLSRGDRAELRRMRGDVAPPAVFWKIVGTYEAAIPRGDEDFWIDVMPLMVMCPHGGAKPGKLLRQAGVSEARIERWLSMPAATARSEARKVLSRLSAGLDWRSLGTLLFYWDSESGANLRRAFARDFFTAPSREDTDSTAEQGASE